MVGRRLHIAGSVWALNPQAMTFGLKEGGAVVLAFCCPLEPRAPTLSWASPLGLGCHNFQDLCNDGGRKEGEWPQPHRRLALEDVEISLFSVGSHRSSPRVILWTTI